MGIKISYFFDCLGIHLQKGLLESKEGHLILLSFQSEERWDVDDKLSRR
jgi:hypothetical protein